MKIFFAYSLLFCTFTIIRKRQRFFSLFPFNIELDILLINKSRKRNMGIQPVKRIKLPLFAEVIIVYLEILRSLIKAARTTNWLYKTMKQLIEKITCEKKKRKNHLCKWAAAAAVISVMSDSVRPHRQQPTRLPCPWDSPGKNTGVGCHFLLQCMKVKSESEVAQLCLTV